MGNLRFLDSLQFLSGSLDTLVQTLIKDGPLKYPNTKRHYPNSDLDFQKGTYPYEFMDGPEKFKLTELPLVKSSTAAVLRRRLCQSSTGVDGISYLEYEEYHDLYLSLDILLLADVFENYRKIGMEYHDLDALHYHTLPGFTLDACLKKTKQSLKQLMSPQHLLFF